MVFASLLIKPIILKNKTAKKHESRKDIVFIMTIYFILLNVFISNCTGQNPIFNFLMYQAQCELYMCDKMKKFKAQTFSYPKLADSFAVDVYKN